ncbi:MAG: hypothetical protein AAGK14_04000 [Verrucomicrobiota bacterium]
MHTAPATPASLAQSLGILLAPLPGLVSAVLLRAGQATVLHVAAGHDPAALPDGAKAARELLLATRNFQMETHWLRLAGERGTLYAFGDDQAERVLVLVSTEPRLEPDWLEAIQATLDAPAVV